MPPNTGHSGHLYQFRDYSVRYFVVARQAFFYQGYVIVSANLFHHAFEYLFKFALIDDATAQQYGGDPVLTTQQQRQAYVQFMDQQQQGMATKYGHRLSNLWLDFKTATGAPLSQFDNIVSDLDRWEALPYPWFPHGSQQLQTLVHKADRVAVVQGAPSAPADRYELCLEEMDELYHAAFLATGLNPRTLSLRLLHREALSAYLRENLHPLVVAPAAQVISQTRSGRLARLLAAFRSRAGALRHRLLGAGGGLEAAEGVPEPTNAVASGPAGGAG
jgi:hypothetical protein